MDGLRWVLLIVGLLVIAGVYLYSRRERERPHPDPRWRVFRAKAPRKLVPSLDESRSATDTYRGEDNRSSWDASEQKIVTLRLVARGHGAFAGDELALSLRGIGMRHGKFGIFHRYEANDEKKTIFSAASLVEPGSFDLPKLKEQRIPGVSLFMILPGPIDGVRAFDLMMSAARGLAQSLNGELLDETGSSLSIQRERYLREEVIQFQHGLTVA
ncbi:MAG: cell division protein ZipA C-terminal FtsZ-binding domain-containing protein [Woeseiaceae bacterium]